MRSMPKSVKLKTKSSKWIIVAVVALIVTIPVIGIAIGYLLGPAKTSGNIVTIVIPMGAEQQIRQGRDVIPARIVGRVGDRLVLINKDKAAHHIGIFFLRPGEKLEYPLIRPGNYSALCTLTSTKRFELIILPQSKKL